MAVLVGMAVFAEPGARGGQMRGALPPGLCPLGLGQGRRCPPPGLGRGGAAHRWGCARRGWVGVEVPSPGEAEAEVPAAGAALAGAGPGWRCRRQGRPEQGQDWAGAEVPAAGDASATGGTQRRKLPGVELTGGSSHSMKGGGGVPIGLPRKMLRTENRIEEKSEAVCT